MKTDLLSSFSLRLSSPLLFSSLLPSSLPFHSPLPCVSIITHSLHAPPLRLAVHISPSPGRQFLPLFLSPPSPFLLPSVPPSFSFSSPSPPPQRLSIFGGNTSRSRPQLAYIDASVAKALRMLMTFRFSYIYFLKCSEQEPMF